MGWTGIFKQPADWYKHNCILSDLTNKSWPVYYKNNGENSMLTYYIGQYILPCFIGKITSSIITTQIANGIWAMIGLLLSLLGIFKVTKSDTKEKQIVALIILFMFSACVSLSQNIGKLVIPDKIYADGHWLCFFGDYKLQLSSNIVLLRWVMPQCIIPWIIICLFYDDPYNIENYVICCIPALFYSTLSFISLCIILIFMVFIKYYKERNISNILKEIFSISNIITVITLGVILLAYFGGNVFSSKPESIGFDLVSYDNENFLIYAIFITEFIPYTILLFKSNKKNPLYWISTIILLVLPFAKMGLFNDLLMRCSIVPLFIYMLLCIKELFNKDSKQIIKILLILFLAMRKLFKYE
ncbi:MAG: hypothetical protein IJH39_04195 [Clostridia bacterium]|nr:hypothetical protein [Clostridia bacterium]